MVFRVAMIWRGLPVTDGAIRLVSFRTPAQHGRIPSYKDANEPIRLSPHATKTEFSGM